MATMSIETTDLFRSAYLLCKGGCLIAIHVNPSVRSRVATFEIQGDGIEAQDRAYRRGDALVNPLQYRESITHLRDLLFDKLRKSDRPTPKGYGTAREGRNGNGRKRENRSYKARH